MEITNIDTQKEEKKQKFISNFEKTYDDCHAKLSDVIKSYQSYRNCKDNQIELEDLFQELRIKDKSELFPRLAKLHKPSYLHPSELGEWLRYLGYLMPHKSKPKTETVPKSAQKQISNEPDVQVIKLEETVPETETIVDEYYVPYELIPESKLQPEPDPEPEKKIKKNNRKDLGKIQPQYSDDEGCGWPMSQASRLSNNLFKHSN